MGEMDVPADALYGASTQRAVFNFPISGRAAAAPVPAGAGAHQARGRRDQRASSACSTPDVAAAIAAAAAEVADGGHDDQFPIDIYQTGSGTSTNTNMNEVDRPPRARPAGRGRKVHPNDDVNRCQSSNDTIPTALQLSAAVAIEEDLLPALERLHTALAAASRSSGRSSRPGRTHLQDATPIRLGQEFRGYAGQVEEALRRARAAQAELLAVPLGGTAVGTGINAHPEYALADVRPALGAHRPAPSARRRTTSTRRPRSTRRSPPTAAIRTIALEPVEDRLGHPADGDGPAGRASRELALPETQPGSSIMPGKVNPVIVESLTMVVARVIGNDATIAFGQTGSFLELNVMLPVTAAAMLESIALLAAAARTSASLRRRPHGDRARAELVEQGLMLATALAPVIGYDAAATMAKEGSRPAARSASSRSRGGSRRRLDELLDPAAMTEPGLGAGPGGGSARGWLRVRVTTDAPPPGRPTRRRDRASTLRGDHTADVARPGGRRHHGVIAPSNAARRVAVSRREHQRS